MTRTRAAQALLVLSAAVWAARLGPSDRWLVTGLLAYVPPAATLVASVVAWHLVRRGGRAAVAWRAGALALAAASLVRIGLDNPRLLAAPAEPPPGAGMTVVHWNVGRSAAAVRSLATLDADVVALNETDRVPPGAMGEGWTVWDDEGLRIAARYPIERRGVWRGPWAHGLHALVRTDPPLSLLLVDVAANPHLSRRRALESLAAALPAMMPAPDLIVGDFNTPAHAFSLSGVVAAGWLPASGPSSAGLWYTWPSYLPVMRIDHLFVRPGVAVLAHGSGFSWRSDHRWQRVVVVPPRPDFQGRRGAGRGISPSATRP